MNPCQSFAADLDLLAAGLLLPDRVRAAEAHLRGCAACRVRYEHTTKLCAELVASGHAAGVPAAAAWRLRRLVHAAVMPPAPGMGGRWQTAAVFLAGVVCTLLFVHRTDPPRPAIALVTPPAADPPLTLLAYERAAARSDAALDQMLARGVAHPQATPGEPPLRVFPLTAFRALEQND